MQAFIALATVWSLLALATLALVIQNSSSISAAFVAWVGGIITCRLWQQFFVLRDKRRASKPV